MEKICKCCGELKILTCHFYYCYGDLYRKHPDRRVKKGKVKPLRIFINCEDIHDHYDWDYMGDVETYKNYESIKHFLSDFLWMVNVELYKLVKSDDNDNNNEEEKQFCSSCFYNLIKEKKIKYNNNTQSINYPLYTDCCQKFHEKRTKNNGLLQICKMSCFPYLHYYWINEPIDEEIYGYQFPRLEGFPFSPEYLKNINTNYIVCKECMKPYENFIISEEETDKIRDIDTMTYREKGDHPLYLIKKLIREEKDLTPEYIYENYDKDYYVWKHVRNVLSLKRDLKQFFRKRAMYNISMIYLNFISLHGYTIHKDVKRLIAKLCAS